MFLQRAMCREFVEFLCFTKYDIIYLLEDLAQHFYSTGDAILELAKTYDFCCLELYAITERLKLPCPATYNAKKIYDFSHVLDFCSQLHGITVQAKKV